MTEELIKEYADLYTESLICENLHRTLYSSVDFIAGAHSRDKEVDGMQDIISQATNLLRNGDARLLAKYMEQKIEIEKLLNPWTLIKDGLPEEDKDNEGYSVKVIGLFEGDGKKYISDCFCSIEEGIWYVDIFTSDQPIAWMPIPKFNK